MMDKLRWPFRACGCLLLVFCVSSSAIAQVSEVDFKALYAAAEYDKALEVIASLDSLESQQYKALCLLALGRNADASTAIESLVNAAPTFTPSADDAPPRFVELVSKARQKLPANVTLGWTQDGGSLLFTLPRVFLPKPKRQVTGPKGIQATFNYQASGANGAQLTTTLVNDVASYA